MPNELTTTRGFRYPTAQNNGSDFSTGIQDFANDVDSMWRIGTLASRPAANAVKPLTHYFATDTHQLFLTDGTSWYGFGGTGMTRQSHSYTMDDATYPEASASVLGSFAISPAQGEVISLVEARFNCRKVGSAPSVFKVQTDHPSQGALVDVAGLTNLQPAAGAMQAATPVGGAYALSAGDSLSVTIVAAGLSLGCTVTLVTEHVH